MSPKRVLGEPTAQGFDQVRTERRFGDGLADHTKAARESRAEAYRFLAKHLSPPDPVK